MVLLSSVLGYNKLNVYAFSASFIKQRNRNRRKTPKTESSALNATGTGHRVVISVSRVLEQCKPRAGDPGAR